jgi:uncharacterized membrane protein YeaQ/YmgE (transglycosylase-associated protein family)
VAWESGVLNIQVCARQGFTGTVSYTGYQCRGSAAADTDFLLASTIDEWGVSGALRASLVKRAVNQVEEPCSECAAILEQAGTRLSGSRGTSPIVWIYVFWCLIGGVLGAVIAESKNRKAWQGALLGVLLGLIGVLIIALLPNVSDTSAPTSLPPPPRDAQPPSTAQSATPDDDENPLEAARARYARGDITREEFKEITAALGHPGWSPRV